MDSYYVTFSNHPQRLSLILDLSSLKMADRTSHFVPKDDDDETLWDVKKILDERADRYLIRWAGVDPAGRPWEDSWVPRCDVTDDLVLDWNSRREVRSRRGRGSRRGRSRRGSRKGKSG